MSKVNLNRRGIETEERNHRQLFENTNTNDDFITVVFRDIETFLIQLIRHHQDSIIVGCVAWLTSFDILDALRCVKSVNLIVQKEDFLRPDCAAGTNNTQWKNALRDKYDALHSCVTRYEFPHILSACSVCTDPGIEAVRCAGIAAPKNQNMPRMHNKFLVFCDEIETEDKWREGLVARRVWTGSYNLSMNSKFSLENGLFIQSEKIADAYLREFEQIAAISEPLDWNHHYVDPEWRIGT